MSQERLGEGDAVATERPPVAAFLSLSNIARDPRVMRHCRALADDGWQVTSIGFGDPAGVSGWSHIEVPEIPIATKPDKRARRILNLLAVRAFPSRARVLWHDEARYRALGRAADTIGAADLVVANDYVSLPAAIDLARRCRAALIYDTHEYAAVERAEDARWRLLYPPTIRALEREAAGVGASWVTVSDGIATSLARDYGLAQRPAVIRNLPAYQRQAFHPARDPMLVHYHGVLMPGRGLETLIDSVPLWRNGLRLRIRGPGDGDYRGALASRAEALGCADRVAIEPALPMQHLVAGANDADIGIHMLPPFSDQNRFALPNKLFEYLMAGLAVVISDLPEMAGIVRKHDVGICVEAGSPKAIADVLNRLMTAQVESWKRNALVAAEELCWDRERLALVRLCRGLHAKTA